MEEAFKINQKSSKNRNDSAVQGTNDSSVLSKISTAQLGYFKDDFLKYFASKIARRSPLVNRGYYIRAKLIDLLAKEFLNNFKNTKNQFINLGAGFDSSFFRLKDQELLNNTIFIEIDFPDVINRKINLIQQNENLLNLCSDLTKSKDINGNTIYQSIKSNYILIGLDMRNTKLLEAILKSINGFSESDPTFLLSEVVMTYMSVNSCNGVIKWINEMFLNCCLTVYEQINPHDSFGQVMCCHFQKLGSPLKCILKYPKEQDQINRYKKEGFTDTFTIKASEFYQYNISSEEKDRIDKIELFDEYEPWHLKCSHYTLLSATKGDSCTNLVKNLYSKLKYRILPKPNLISFDSDVIKLKNFPIKFGVRFGHSVCVLGKKIFVFGGFGELATDKLGKHLRLPNIECVDLEKMSLKVLEFENKPVNDRIFQCGCTLNNNSIIISFGRSNPSKLFDSLVKLNYNSVEEEFDEKNISFEVYNLNEFNLARFRHSICEINESNLFVYGGKYFDEASNSNRILNDAYLIENFTNVRKIQVDENICKSRHSHSMCRWKQFLVLTGGLDENETPLNDLIFIDTENFEFKKVKLNKGNLLTRYSHTSHVIDDYLILIGGTNLEENPPGLCIVDLNRLIGFEFDLPVEVSENNNRLIISCHQTHLLNKNEILLIGGGAVCFTFGTHLNKLPVLLDISNCWSKINQYLD